MHLGYDRRALEDCTIGGYHIPTGMTINFCRRTADLSEKYFRKARNFKPECWMGDGMPEQLTRACVPFSGSDHICVGAGFGKMAVMFTPATICQHQRIDVISQGFREVNTTALFRLRNGLLV